MRALRRFRQLSWHDRWSLTRALLLLSLWRVALRLLGLRRFQAALSRMLPRQASRVAPQQARSLARGVRAAARHGLIRATCLEQSLLIWWLLRRAGIAAELRIGVTREDQQLLAHAWVETSGTVLNDDPAVTSRFRAFDRPIA